ncbi:MAG: AraC family transcriptional regulator [Chitinophagales bacterium]|nr:AraC family transcriptional regulator [Chitinophagales bacterium]
MNYYQFEKYKLLVEYIDANLKDKLRSTQVEQICHYSYRNMNRIFLALQGETIGRHIKRKRIEKAAEYLCYSDNTVSDISYELGFNDIATFSKAFKNKYGDSPTDFRSKSNVLLQPPSKVLAEQTSAMPPLEFEIEELPSFGYVYFEYHGDYENVQSLETLWEEFYQFCEANNLVSSNSIFFGAILDDNDISEKLYCRYRAGLILERRWKGTKERRAGIAEHPRQLYAKFIHEGEGHDTEITYHKIYSQWMDQIDREFADLPTLEFYHTDPDTLETNLTEIYIPIL